MKKSGSKVIYSDRSGWKEIEKKAYKEKGSLFKDIHRFTLLGSQIPELNFETRYFEIGPGGYSSLEYHRHPHSVIILKGRGTVILDNELCDLSLHDVVYIAPETIHQFHADQNEPLGFICIVDRYRDKPVVPDQDTIHSRISSSEVLNKIKK